MIYTEKKGNELEVVTLGKGGWEAQKGSYVYFAILLTFFFKRLTYLKERKSKRACLNGRGGGEEEKDLQQISC